MQSDISGGYVPTAAILMGLLRVISAENPQAAHAIVDVQGDPASVVDMSLTTQLLQLKLDLKSCQILSWLSLLKENMYGRTAALGSAG